MVNLQKALNRYNAGLTEDGIIGAKTLTAAESILKKQFASRKWVWPVKGLIWIRLDDNLTDTFDDFVVRVQAGKVDMAAPCSTTAGDYYILNPITYQGITGTAIALEQQVLKCHQFITNKSFALLWTKQPYFQQSRPLKIYRDKNKDRKINREVVTEGMYGINLHRGWAGNRNWNCSAGCQIVPDAYWLGLIQPFYNGEYIDFNLIELQ